MLAGEIRTGGGLTSQRVPRNAASPKAQMNSERHFVKASLILIFVFVCAVECTTLAQTSNVRVGPSVDDAATDATAKKDEKKKDTDKKTDAARNAKEQASAPAVSSNASKAAPPNTTNTTTDAPPKSSTIVPVVQQKSTLTAAPEKEEAGGNGSSASHSNKSATTQPDADAKVSTAPLSSTNVYSAPTPPALTSIYRVGVGDVLDIRLMNANPNARSSTLFTVMAGGLIDYPLAGDPINVAGMTTEEIGVRLAAELRRRAVFDKPQLNVTVREYASHTVLVSGLVYDPGVKILRRDAVPLYVIIAEAQPKPEAGRAVIMSHATGKSETVELSNPQALNMLIRPSDVVNVVARPQEFFYIGGEVGTPGQRDFHPGMTLTQAILASGGVSRYASGFVRVSRQGSDGRLISATHNLNQIQNGVVPDPALQAGDRIEVERKK